MQMASRYKLTRRIQSRTRRSGRPQLNAGRVEMNLYFHIITSFMEHFSSHFELVTVSQGLATYIEQVGSIGHASVLYSGGGRLDSLPGQQLSWHF
jgi:hypothetical protein